MTDAARSHYSRRSFAWRLAASVLIAWGYSWLVIATGARWPWLAAMFVAPLWMTIGALACDRIRGHV